MDGFIFEYEMEKVISNTTKQYLTEVISSYENGNYRAAIVVLYSVVLYDLFEKMQILSDCYNDEKARKTLEELKKKIDANISYSECEKFLLEKVQERSLLNNVEMEKIQNLREMRNWCAHPVYNQEYKLINPSREETRAYIRICFEAVFQKEALLSRKILNDVLQQSYDYYTKVSTDRLEIYLNDRFYSKMNQSVKDTIFDSLWDIVLKVCDDDCNKTRISSYYALLYLINKDPKHYYDRIRGKIRYSQTPINEHDISSEYYPISPGNSPLEALIFLVCEHPVIYNCISDSEKVLLQETVKKNSRYMTIAWYTSESMEKHLAMLNDVQDSRSHKKPGWFDIPSWNMFQFYDINFLHRVSEKVGEQQLVRRFIIEQYVNSPSFDCANMWWSNIWGMIDEFLRGEIDDMLKGMNENSQIYGARSKSEVVRELAEYYNNRFCIPIPQSSYPNLW